MSIFRHRPQPTEDDIISNSHLEQLYNHQFEQGRFFQVVFADEDECKIKVASRTMMKVVYIKEKDDIEAIELIKLINGKEKQRVKFSKFNIAQLKMFLDLIAKIDLKGVSERKIALAENTTDLIDEATRQKVATLLSGQDAGEFLQDLLDKGVVTGQDIVNTGYRKQQLEVFRKLLYEEYLNTYKRDVLNSPNTKDETAWQHFFEKNQWIFGYGLDYRFQSILQREFSASDTTAAGKDQVVADYLLGDSRFTTLVELKKPKTPLFEKNQNRSKSWQLSQALTYAVSQILEQKASGMLKIEDTKELYDDQDELITQHAYDPKVILIIGSWEQLQQVGEGKRVQAVKKKTFELYRRDSRNIDIITYDELYERAKFIVENECRPTSKAS